MSRLPLDAGEFASIQGIVWEILSQAAEQSTRPVAVVVAQRGDRQ
jgi:hypothetical protein